MNSDSSQGGRQGRDSHSTTRKRRLDDLVGRYVDLLNAGESIDPDDVLNEHPELGLEILTRLETFVGTNGQTGESETLGALGDYTITREIGKGGMGIVYDAWQNSMERRVALKVLPVGIAANDKAFHRFMREAKTAGKLSHPNVVGVHGLGVEEKTPYYTMEYVEGETLAHVLARLKAADNADSEATIRQSLSRLFTTNGQEDPAVDVEAEDHAEHAERRVPFVADDSNLAYYFLLAAAFAGVADGLQHAHSKGVVHRDIKPSNLIFDCEPDRRANGSTEQEHREHARLRILDFGLARLEGQESLTVSGDLMGTVLYMSPEQAMAKRIPLDHRTDIYSLGATMYEAFTWNVPFQGKDYHDTLSQIILRDPCPLRSLNPRIPKDLETIVLKCLRKDPKDRYGTAEALAQDLRRFVRGDPIEARPLARWERLARQLRHHRARVALAAVMVVSVLAAAGGSYIYLKIEHRRRAERAEVAVEEFCQQANDLRQAAGAGTRGRAKLRDALAVAEKAVERAKDVLDGRLRERAATLLLSLRREVRNRDMLARLDDLPVPMEHFEKEDRRYHDGFPAAFREYGIDVEKLDPEVAGKMIRQTGIAGELALALETWAKLLVELSDLELSTRLIAIAEAADPHPRSRAIRRAVDSGDVAQVLELVSSSNLEEVSDRRVVFLAAHLYNRSKTDEAEALLRRARRVHEDSYWINYWLGFILAQKKEYEASEIWLRVACALRKDKGRVRGHLGKVLTARGKLEEAALAYVAAVNLSPKERTVYAGIPALAKTLLESGMHASLDHLIRTLDTVVDSAPDFHPDALSALVDAWSLRPEVLESHRVLNPVRAEVERTRRLSQPSLAWLARAEFTAGNVAGAVRVLEEGIRLGGWETRTMRALLDGYREALLPDLASYASIDAAVERDASVVLVPEDARWRFFRGRREPSAPLEWTRNDFDDSSWEPGTGGFGYGREDVGTLLDDMKDSYATLYVRHRFSVSDPSVYACLVLSVKADDAYIAFLNGEEVARLRAGGKGTVFAFDARPTPRSGAERFESRQIDARYLQPGENVLALHGLNRWRGSFALIPVLKAVPVADLEQDRRRFRDFRDAARTGPNAEMRLTYLDARLLERAGRHDEAAARLREVGSLDQRQPEPFLRLAEILNATGRSKEAERVLRDFLAGREVSPITFWERWVAISFAKLRRTPAEILEVFPSPVREKAAVFRDTAVSEVERYPEDLRWLLERLARDGAIRINCGGEEYRGADGRPWGRDRFYTLDSGRNRNKVLADKIAGTGDDRLYASYRWFPPVTVYRVPLPVGRYRVTLHWAAVYPSVMTRDDRPRFDVVAEGEVGKENYDPMRNGPARADSIALLTTVEDGVLDIDLVSRRPFELNFVNAIEIEKVETSPTGQ